MSTTDTPAQPLFNPFDPAFRADPYPFYDALRAAEPVHVSPFGFVVITRYDDVARTLRSNEFSRDIEANGDEPASDVGKRKRDAAGAARQVDPQPRPAGPHPAAPPRQQGVHADRHRAPSSEDPAHRR